MNHVHGNEPCTLCWMMYPTKLNTGIFVKMEPPEFYLATYRRKQKTYTYLIKRKK